MGPKAGATSLAQGPQTLVLSWAGQGPGCGHWASEEPHSHLLPCGQAGPVLPTVFFKKCNQNFWGNLLGLATSP